MAVATRSIGTRRQSHWFEQWGSTTVSVVLGAAMTLATVQSIVASNWARGLQVLIAVALGGLLIGAVFARVRGLPSWLAHSLSAIVGIVWAVNRIGPILGSALPTWKDQATELVIRAIILTRTLQNGGTGEDLYLFVGVLALLAWMLGYLTQWLLLRRGWVWLPVIINALVLLVNLTYASPKPPAILFYIFFGAALLLLVHQSYLSRSQTWSAALIEVPDLLGWRFIASGALVVLALLLITSLLPTHITTSQIAYVWQRVRQPWLNVQNTWDRAFSTINAPANASGGGFGGRSLNLSGARSLGTGLVMEVKSVGPDGTPKPDYWRATAYDRYSSDRSGGALSWIDTTGQLAAASLGLTQEEQARTPLDANQAMPQIDTIDRATITQTFTLRQNFVQPTLFAATQPISVSLPTRVKTSFLSTNGQVVANYSDTALLALQRGSVRDGLTYTTTSLVSAADKQSLRNAPMAYPDWVQRYLQLPEDTTLDRVKAKAQEVAGAGTNAYDKAELIQNYLRTIPYDEKIPFPPEDRDPLDWFMFELKRGYCDYYASAMVVMLRAQGIPTRLVSGYATGEFNEEKGVYEVRQNVAHTWVEVYFPGYGWQRFEPTAASYTSVPNRPETPPQANEPGADNEQTAAEQQRNRAIDLAELDRRLLELENGAIDPEQVRAQIAELQAQQQRATMLRWGLIGASVLLIPLLGLAYVRRPRGLSPAAHAYGNALMIARWAGLGPKASATPHEVAAQLADYVPQQRQPLGEIAAAYTYERYSAGKRAPQAAVAKAWQRVRWPLINTMLARWMGVGRHTRSQTARRRRR